MFWLQYKINKMKKTIYFALLLFIMLSYSANISNKSNEVKKQDKPLNIILLIGDGMGLSEVSSAFYYKKDKVNISRFKYIGLFNTSSASHKITDSAAGATAFSCGKKTYNGAIGLNTDTLNIENITELLGKDGYKCGVISTSAITHATPAAFYAHAKSRSQAELIASQLPTSNISFFAGGGLQYFNKRKDGHNYLDSLSTFGFKIDTTALSGKINDYNTKYGFLLAADGMPPILKGRKDFLPNATELAIDYLSKSDKGFFLMVEGSQIDWAGHNNDAEYLISEMIDFDNTIGKALDFAEKDGNTLVIVVADHETGGFALAANDAKGMHADYNSIAPVFATSGHTTTLIPSYAYGPGAENFIGFYQNNDIFGKILKAAGEK
jgi:alkaline phosphatase